MLATMDPNSNDTSTEQVINDSLLQQDNLEVAEHFLSWIKQGLNENSIPVNTPDANIHIVNDGVFLVSPNIFKDYLSMKGINEDMWRRLSKRFANLRVNIIHIVSTGHAMNLHRYCLKKPDGSQGFVNGYLIPFNHFYADNATLPEVNAALTVEPGRGECQPRMKPFTDTK